MRGEAVARHDVEPHAGQERHALRLGFGVPRGEGLEDVDLAGDVEIVDAIAEADVRHRFRRRRERTGDGKPDGHVLDRRIDWVWIAKIEPAGLWQARDFARFFAKNRFPVFRSAL